MSNQIAAIPFHGQTVQSVEVDGKPTVAFKPMVENLGLDYSRQLKKLKGKSWATVTNIVTVGADGKNREMSCIDLRTLTMWLATIDENRVNEEARPLVVAYQNEVADAIESYWANGGAINPRATEHQINALIRQSQMQMELCQAAKGLIRAEHLEAKARIILARGLGEAPELDEETRPLYTADFLKGKNLSSKKMRSIAGVFGKRMKAAYTLEYGREPEKYPLNLPNGQVRQVNAYTELDRPLMEQVWDKYFTA
ncbi:phage antirepressor N-terminal domain-containing protein [Corynebacterium amycolatum]|uniref:Phage antirepressor N-terminal domain-containing protein n=1 Tax=Corynebacterium amycolatum TaxID=43765 RepID=A0AB37GD36_CORAY|nr:phage antirepressor N-terminal domain-containing protein [Corynebacterium amycolatum]QPR31873.1 phage antirepressor N-terminal domain-containing protein [Corynebacterium amycolatum]QQB83750.1 phage antirepressor N-terminal domain-containing protein [Corynebacterium amycolatum]